MIVSMLGLFQLSKVTGFGNLRSRPTTWPELEGNRVGLGFVNSEPSIFRLGGTIRDVCGATLIGAYIKIFGRIG